MNQERLEIAYRDPIAAFAPACDTPFAMLLLGAGGHRLGRWSYALLAPEEALVVRTPREAARLEAFIGAPAEAATALAGGGFCGGVAGYFAYELGGAFEPAAPQRLGAALPLAALARHRLVAAFDGEERRAFILHPADAGGAAAARALAARLGDAGPKAGEADGSITARDSLARYGAQVAHLKTRIAAGDIFQANISRRFDGGLGAGDHPYRLFARLARESPAPFAAYMRLPEAAIVSNSPERYLSVRRDECGALRASTGPIKGTRPRGRTPAEDAALVAALRASEKDRAENLMIVDLMRNDLARVCAPGTVRAPRLFEVESYAAVHHLVSTVEGVLRPGLGGFALAAAGFPAGSITGAPKIMAMRLIDALEAEAREMNYGAIGWFGADGAMDLNVAIRTATCVREGARWATSFRVGGGVTIDSEPDEEGRETETKARSLVRAITGRAL